MQKEIFADLRFNLSFRYLCNDLILTKNTNVKVFGSNQQLKDTENIRIKLKAVKLTH